jgi:hypothetical protein
VLRTMPTHDVPLCMMPCLVDDVFRLTHLDGASQSEGRLSLHLALLNHGQQVSFLAAHFGICLPSREPPPFAF